MQLLHVGDHTGLRLRELAAHIFELDHFVFAAVTVLVGIWIYRYGSRVKARVCVEKGRRS
jgi:hypothetical protein